MQLIRFIFSKQFAKHVLLAILVLLAAPVALYFYLGTSTGHGDHIDVPELRGLSMAEATNMLQELNLEALVIDSVFSEEGTPGAIFEQSPPPHAEVKIGRSVYLTVFRMTPPSEVLKVEEGMNERVAEIILQNKGLKFEKQYVEDQLLAGMVVKVVQRGMELPPNAQIRRGDRVTLVIGKLGDEEVPMPSFLGLSLDSAKKALSNARLTLGSTLYDSDVITNEDSLQARVYAQSPSANTKRLVQVGSLVDLFLGLRDLPDSTANAVPLTD